MSHRRDNPDTDMPDNIPTPTAPPVALDQVVRARLDAAKAALNAKWLRECDEALDWTGVPKWVCLGNETVPSNTVPSRLKWYLLRRKAVKPWEKDSLDREMELNVQQAREYEDSAP